MYERTCTSSKVSFMWIDEVCVIVNLAFLGQLHRDGVAMHAALHC